MMEIGQVGLYIEKQHHQPNIFKCVAVVLIAERRNKNVRCRTLGKHPAEWNRGVMFHSAGCIFANMFLPKTVSITFKNVTKFPAAASRLQMGFYCIYYFAGYCGTGISVFLLCFTQRMESIYISAERGKKWILPPVPRQTCR